MDATMSCHDSRVRFPTRQLLDQVHGEQGSILRGKQTILLSLPLDKLRVHLPVSRDA